MGWTSSAALSFFQLKEMAELEVRKKMPRGPKPGVRRSMEPT
jgi:hypothetical protein